MWSSKKTHSFSEQQIKCYNSEEVKNMLTWKPNEACERCITLSCKIMSPFSEFKVKIGHLLLPILTKYALSVSLFWAILRQEVCQFARVNSAKFANFLIFLLAKISFHKASLDRWEYKKISERWSHCNIFPYMQNPIKISFLAEGLKNIFKYSV